MNQDANILQTPALGFEGSKWTSYHWYALYTRSRHEKIVKEELQKKQLETFLPLRKITRQWSDRKKIIEEPLFKSYLFVRIPLSEKLKVLNTVGVVQFVCNRGAEPVSVPEKELLTIKSFIESSIQIDPFPYLKEGEKVYIRSGPFRGAEGFIVRKARHCRLIISLDVLMQSISVEIDEACVEPA